MRWQAKLFGVATINALGEAWGGKKRDAHKVIGADGQPPPIEALQALGIKVVGIDGNHAD